MNRKTPLITAGLVILLVAVFSVGLYTNRTYNRMKGYISTELSETYRYVNKLLLDLRSLNLLFERYLAAPTSENFFTVSETVDLIYFRTDLIADNCSEVNSPLDLNDECNGLFNVYTEFKLHLNRIGADSAEPKPRMRELMDKAEIIGMTMMQKTDLLVYRQMLQSEELLGQAGKRILMFLSVLSLALLVIAVLSFRQIKISKQLQANELKFKSVFNEAFQLFAQLDTDGRILDINNAALKIAGKTREEVTGSLFSDGPWWSHSAVLQARLSEAIGTAVSGRTVRMNVRHFDTEGRPVHIDFSLKPIFDSEGSVTLLIAEGRDITAIIETEKELTRLRNYLSNMIDSMPSVIIGVDSEGLITQWNRTAGEVAGIGAESAIGSSVAELIPGISKDLGMITDSIETGNTLSELRRASVFGHEGRFEDMVVYPLKGGDENGAVIRIDDVTEIVNMQEKIIQSEKMLSVGGLAAGLAHEINNPLAGMMQTAEVLYDRLSASEIPANVRAAERAGLSLDAVKRYMSERNILDLLEGIRTSGLRAASIVGNMLSFARKSSTAKSPDDIVRLMKLSLELASTDYSMKKQYDFDQIRVIWDVEADLPKVMCEGQKIQQVFLNILKNGAQAMSGKRSLNRDAAGGYTPEFRISFRSLYNEDSGIPRGVIIEIADNGPGMPEDVRRRIFEPFFTTKTVGEGTGLGLSVSYFIITENHGGTFRVESTEGEGTRFIIQLP